MNKVNNQAPLTHRQRQALETRRLILEAARRLFLEQGYGSATIEAIASQAGVSVSSIYANFGSKRGILRGIREAWHQESHIREVAHSASPDMDGEVLLERLAHATRRQWETGADVLSIYRSAAAADRDASAELAEALQGRQAAFERLAEGLRPYRSPGLSDRKTAALLRALCLPEIHAELVIQSGWTEDDYEAWLASTLKQALLR